MAPKFVIGVSLKVHSTSAANRTRSLFVLLCRLKFVRDTAIISLTKYFPYLYYNRSNIAKITYIARRCLCTARSTSSERALLLVCSLAAKVHLYRAEKVFHSVRPSVQCLRFTQIGMP